MMPRAGPWKKIKESCKLLKWECYVWSAQEH